jgi:hypothetical protein
VSQRLAAFLSILSLVGGLAIGVVAQNSANSPAATAARVSAAQKFLASLTPAQTALASLPFGDAKKANWNNLPPSFAPRAGVTFRDLTPEQQRLGTEVLRSVLSPYGFDKVKAIMAADDFFGQARDRFDASTGGGGRGGFPTGPSAYMLAIFGTPSATQPWAVQFGGHHLGVNVTVVSPNDVLAPTLTAAYPNMYEKDGKSIFVLNDEATRALKLQQSMTPVQAAKAVQKAQVWDFVLGPGHDNEVIQPEGLRGSEMTPAQQQMLLDVAAAWVNIVDDVSSRAKMDELRRNIGDTYWLWSGDATKAGNAYFRIQGPTVLIEYSPQTLGGPGSTPALYPPGTFPSANAQGFDRGGGGRGGPGADGRGRAGRGDAQVNDPNRKIDPIHVHTVYRDFTNDYGKKFLNGVR